MTLSISRPAALFILTLFGVVAYLSFSSSLSSAPLLVRRPPILNRKPAAPLVVEPELDTSGVFRKRIVAVADIHGDLPHLTKILRGAGIIDLRGLWTGGEAILVQTGDIVDRGRDTIALYRFFDTLRPQAERAGGGVVSLLGNHELMNAMGDWRYVTKEDIATFGGERQRREAMSTGWIGQTWRTNYSITARIPFTHGFSSLPSSLIAELPSSPLGRSSQQFLGDPARPQAAFDPFSHAAASFVHGGILPAYMDGLKSEAPISEINSIGNDLLYSLLAAASPLVLPRNASEEQREFWSERGPMWDRSYALDEDEKAVCARAADACKKLGVSYLIMGHTPTFEGIRTRCKGSVILIDTGISRAYGGSLSALEILVTLSPQFDFAGESLRDKPSSWTQNEEVSALYLDKRGREKLSSRERVVELPAQ